MPSVSRSGCAAVISMVAIVLAGCSSANGGDNDSAAAGGCFEGRQIDFGVPYAAGAGYDQYARLLSPYMEDELGATIVVRNEPGAGGLVSLAANQNGDPKKPRLQIMEGFSTVGAQIGQADGVQYDVTKWPWVGRLVAEPEIVFTGSDSAFKTWDDVLAAKDRVRFGSTGPGASDFIQGTVLRDAFKAPIDLKTGFEGTSDISAAMLRGDVDLTESSLGTALPMIKDGSVRPLLTVAAKRSEELPDVPTPSDYTDKMTNDGAAAMNGIIAMIEVGRAVATTPGIPDGCLEELRGAFDAAVANPQFLAQAKDAGRPVQPLSGSELANVVDGVFKNADGGNLANILTHIYQ
jgi:tripartite-type tricarboxylate transporter receptor subunit TctC